jgi:hypothetical protein
MMQGTQSLATLALRLSSKIIWIGQDFIDRLGAYCNVSVLVVQFVPNLSIMDTTE